MLGDYDGTATLHSCLQLLKYKITLQPVDQKQCLISDSLNKISQINS